MHKELCTSKIITMEYCPGTKISDIDGLRAKGFDPDHVSTLLTNSYLEQARSGRDLVEIWPRSGRDLAEITCEMNGRDEVRHVSAGMPARLLPL